MYKKNKEEYRHKNYENNLAIIYIQSVLLNQFNNIKEELINELFVRQIFWIIIKINGFDEFDRLSSKTLNYIFDECKSGYIMFSLIYKLNSLLDKFYMNRLDALKRGEENYGLLNFEFENSLHNNILKILAMDSFENFFLLIEKQYSVEIMENLFKKNINLSKEKGYHGNIDNYLGKKNIEIQYTEYNSYYDNFLNILNSNFEEAEFKKILFKNFKIVEYLYNQCKLPLTKIMKIIDHHDYSKLLENEIDIKSFEIIKKEYLKKYKTKTFNYQFYNDNFSFKDAYIKLSIEKELKFLFLTQNLKNIHKICNLLENYEIDCLLLPCINISKIKSKYYYSNIILNKLKKVKNYIIKPIGTNFTLKFFNEIVKGFNEKSESSDKFYSLNIFYLDNYNENKIELFKNINKIYSGLDELKCIKLYKSNLIQDYQNKKFFLNILIKNKNLKEINIDGSFLKCGDLFEGLIDGLMKSKSIENLILKNMINNNELIELFLYNLTFSKNLKYLNISGVNNDSLNDKFWSNLGKLVSISNDLIKLKLKIFNSSKYIYKFFNKIGYSNSLKIWNLSQQKEKIYEKDLKILAKNIAFNSKLSKNEIIEEWYLNNVLTTFRKSKEFFEGFKISNKELAIYEGEEEVAKNLSNKHHQTYISNKLKILSIEKCEIEYMKDLSAKIKVGFKIPFVEFLRFSNSLEYLNLNNLVKNESLINYIWGAYNQNLYDDLNKNSKIMSRKETKYKEFFIEEDVEKIDNKFICKPNLKVLLLDNTGIWNDNIKILKKIINFLKKLEVLSLRNNLIGISLQNLYENFNKNLKLLDLYKNLMGIEGSLKLSENISKSNLEYLDLGFNNIKNKGILKIIKELIKNKNEKLAYLGVSHNNFKDNSIEFIIDNLINKNLNLKGVFCKHNNYDNFNINNNYEKSKYLDCFFDCFNKLNYFPKERFERMIWIPKYFSKNEILKMFSNIIKKNNKIENLIINIIHKNDLKKNHINNSLKFTFIEFLNDYSTKKVIHLVQRKKIKELKNIKIFKASTSTYNYIKFKKKKTLKYFENTNKKIYNNKKNNSEFDSDSFEEEEHDSDNLSNCLLRQNNNKNCNFKKRLLKRYKY